MIRIVMILSLLLASAAGALTLEVAESLMETLKGLLADRP